MTGPFAASFVDLRAEAIAALSEARAQQARIAGQISAAKTLVTELESVAETTQAAEDGLLRTLGNMERWARGEFD